MTITYLSDSDFNPIYKRQYLKLEENLFSSYGNVWGMLKKTYGKGGDELKGPIQTTFGGGVGASSDGTLPNANHEAFLDPTYTWKRVYANIRLDGLAMKAARKSEHAFINVADRATLTKMQSFNRFIAGTVLFGDGTGALGQFSGNASGTAAAPVLTILNSGTYNYIKGNWEKGDDVNVNSLSSVWRITAVDHANRSITLSRLSGSDDLTAIGAGTHTVYMQNSKDVCPYGIKGIIDNSSHYGVSEEYRYAPTEVAAGSVELEDEMMVELIEKMSEDTDEYPNLIVMPPVQYRNWLALQEDKKRIPTTLSRKVGKNNIGSDKALAKISYNGLALAGGDGDIMVVKSKFVQPDRIYALNTNYIEVLAVGDKPGFQAQDGNKYLRVEGKDAYGAFLAWYGEILINPFHVGAVTGLAVTNL